MSATTPANSLSGQHALCWIHAERLVHKLDTFTDDQRAAQQLVRALIGQLYADLKNHRITPTPWQRAQLSARFDYIFRRHTGFVTLDRLLQRRNSMFANGQLDPRTARPRLAQMARIRPGEPAEIPVPRLPQCLLVIALEVIRERELALVAQ